VGVNGIIRINMSCEGYGRGAAACTGAGRRAGRARRGAARRRRAGRGGGGAALAGGALVDGRRARGLETVGCREVDDAAVQLCLSPLLYVCEQLSRELSVTTKP
jgi:hypothetical protein